MGELLDELSRRRFEASCRQPITSIHFEERARRYLLAAALTDRRRDRERFRDWAGMFEKIAFDLRRLEANNLERRIMLKDGAIEIPTRPRKDPW
jgi:D-alanyl-D-alanine dipeptidase